MLGCIRGRVLSVGMILVGWTVLRADSPNSGTAEVRDYRTVENAATAKIVPAAAAGQTGYLGAAVAKDAQGRLVVEGVQPNSPAAKGGIKKGDVVTRVGDHPVKTVDAFREWVQARGPGDTLKFSLVRDGQPMEVSATLIAASRPMKLGGVRVFLGAETAAAKEDEGAKVDRVTADSPAAKAGVKVGDFLIRADDADLSRGGRLNDVLAAKRPGDSVALTIRRASHELTLHATLVADRGGGPGGPGGGGGGGRGQGADSPAAVVVPAAMDLPAQSGRRTPFVSPSSASSFPTSNTTTRCRSRSGSRHFSASGVYAGKKNATGQDVHGSLNDYFLEQSAGALHVEGKAIPWIEVGKKRGDYIQGSGTSNKTAVLTEAMDKIIKRDGPDAFKDFDGLLFIYAGERYQTNRGAVYYPHAGVVNFQGKRTPYLLGIEGGSRMTPIGGFVKELGRVLGLPDLAARPENQGSEGLGPWCAMSNPFNTARPQHLSAWAKEKMGWIHPTVIDPTVKQRLTLAPIEDSPKQCFKVLVRPDGSEYFLLENRRKKGFDADLAGEGLLIWRVVNDRPVLEEAHGVEGPAGPTVHLSSVPFPITTAKAFTPETIPSSRSPLGGGLPVSITEIRRLPDGRVAFNIGYEFN